MVFEYALKYTVAILNELNEHDYNLDNFERDSNVLMKLLKKINMLDIEENLDLVKKKCLEQLSNDTVIEISDKDKKYILRYSLN